MGYLGDPGSGSPIGRYCPQIWGLLRFLVASPSLAVVVPLVNVFGRLSTFLRRKVCVCACMDNSIYIIYIYNGVFLVINLRASLATSSRMMVRSRGLYPFALDRKSYHRYCQFMVLTTSLFLPVIIIVCVCVCSRTSRNGRTEKQNIERRRKLY